MGRTGQHGHALRGDVFEPPAAFPRPAPVLVYLHGGGWVCGSPATYHKLLAHFAARGFVVVAPDYPHAPEHPSPAAEDACLAAALWAKENAPAFGGDATSMMVAGDSAGAWLAVRLAAATEGIGLFSSAALLYGWFDASEAALADLARRDAGFAQSLAFMARAYLGSGAQRSVFEEFRHLPPTMVVFGALDPLAGQSEAAAAALAAHANDEDADGLLVVPGVGHGFLQCDLFAATTPTLDAVAAFLHGPGG
jgi:acetyl esterase/lipase